MGYWKYFANNKSPFKPYRQAKRRAKKDKTPLIKRGNFLATQLAKKVSTQSKNDKMSSGAL